LYYLTGTALVTTPSGESAGEMKYYPFGEYRNSTGNVATDRLFTGQRLDSTGLYYYNARYYDPQIGRFISADTIVPDWTNPQSMNRYSYCLDNPLKYIDPSGHTTFSVVYSISIHINIFNFEKGMAYNNDHRGGASKNVVTSSGLGEKSDRPEISITVNFESTNADTVDQLGDEIHVGIDVIEGGGIGSEFIFGWSPGTNNPYQGYSTIIGLGSSVGFYSNFQESNPYWTSSAWQLFYMSIVDKFQPGRYERQIDCSYRDVADLREDNEITVWDSKDGYHNVDKADIDWSTWHQ
jgi:RHS repeat-associated protein